MTKQEVIKRIQDESGVEQVVIKKVLQAYIDVIKQCLLEEKKSISFRNFGTFFLKHRAAKTARNITKNTTMIIPPHDIIAFKPSKEFADSLK